MKVIKEFDGGCGRIGKIWVEKGMCDLCEKEKICIVSDGSEGEYRCAFICPQCAYAASEDWNKR